MSDLSSPDYWLPALMELPASRRNQEIYDWLCPRKSTELKVWCGRLEKIRNANTETKGAAKKKWEGRRNRILGKVFEHVIKVCIKDTQALIYASNIQSTTAELDFLISVTPLGSQLLPFLREFGSSFIGEAKCTLKGPKTEWVSELCNLMDQHNCNRAMLFVSCPPRKLDSNIRTAIAINGAKDRIVIPFGVKQLSAVMSGDNFLQVLERQYLHAKNHTSDLEV